MSKLLKFESKSSPLLPQRHFYNRLIFNLLFSGGIILFFLGAGVVGYHITCGFSWIDSLLNASMILSGMGLTNPIESTGGKLFASVYALVSGVVFISTIGIALAPAVHRVFHQFHLEEES